MALNYQGKSQKRSAVEKLVCLTISLLVIELKLLLLSISKYQQYEKNNISCNGITILSTSFVPETVLIVLYV